MIIKSLRVSNLRAIEEAEFGFQPGFNLIVGVNGVGKTTVLNALSISLSSVIRTARRLRSPARKFSVDDIRIGSDALTIDCEFRIGELEQHHIVQRPRDTNVPQKAQIGMPRAQVSDTPRRSEYIVTTPSLASSNFSDTQPFGVFFSTNRAVPSGRAPRKGSVAGGMAAAFAGAFADRELQLGEFAAWMKVLQSMRTELVAAEMALAACQHTVTRFLPEYRNLRIGGEDEPLLLIDRETATIPVPHLSDGERGILALVLDLTRRLTQANPSLDDPASEAEAVVLIDELELHLHPKWQRRIVSNLRSAFPRCQFIATTHSPQIIGEVPHDHIQIMSDGMVYPPSHSLGVDSSRVLEEIMDANPRTESVANLLSDVHAAMDDENVDLIKALLERLIEVLGEGDPEITRIQIFLDLMEE